MSWVMWSVHALHTHTSGRSNRTAPGVSCDSYKLIDPVEDRKCVSTDSPFSDEALREFHRKRSDTSGRTSGPWASSSCRRRREHFQIWHQIKYVQSFRPDPLTFGTTSLLSLMSLNTGQTETVATRDGNRLREDIQTDRALELLFR